MVVTLADKPGSLGNVPSKLGVAGMNIDCAYTSRAKEKGKVNLLPRRRRERSPEALR